MRNQSFLNCKIEYCPVELPDEFPISYLSKGTYSPPSEQISYMHYHNNIELGYCYEGCGLFFINNKIVPFSAGDVSIIYKDEIHIAQSDKSMPSHWGFISVDPLKLLKELDVKNLDLISTLLECNQTSTNIFNMNDNSGICKLVHELFCELQKQENNYIPMVKSLVWSLMAKLTRIEPSFSSINTKDFHQNLMKVSSALKYIAENYSSPVTLKELSQKCNMSIAHFRRIFCTVMQTPPSEYLYMVRIKMASILLVNNDESILEISLKVGYPTLSGFNRHFKKIMGVSPSKWKKQHDLSICSNEKAVTAR